MAATQFDRALRGGRGLCLLHRAFDAVGLRVVLVVVLLAGAETAHAQTPAVGERGWLSAGVGVTMQPDGPEECPQLCGALGGSGVGVTAGAGLRFTRRVALIVEATRAALLEGPQDGRLTAGTVALSTEHRDSLLSGGLSVSLHQGRQGATIDGVILGGIARRRTARSGTRYFFTSTSQQAPYSDLLVDTVPVVGAGLDVRLRIAKNVNLVPSVRVHVLLDDDTADNQPPRRGVGRVLATAVVGIRVVF